MQWLSIAEAVREVEETSRGCTIMYILLGEDKNLGLHDSWLHRVSFYSKTKWKNIRPFSNDHVMNHSCSYNLYTWSHGVRLSHYLCKEEETKEIAASMFFWKLDRGCSTEVEHTPHDREVVGSNPQGAGLFSLLFLSLYLSSSIFQLCVLN